jgi:hypothetical protein
MGDISDATRHIDSILNPSFFYSASMIGRLDGEAPIRRLDYHRPIEKVETYGFVGLIINPITNTQVQIAWPFDVGSPRNQEELAIFTAKYGDFRRRKHPRELLTRNSMYNELVIRGNSDPQQIVGISVQLGRSEADNQKHLNEAEAVQRLLKNRYGIEVPIVPIEVPVEPESKLTGEARKLQRTVEGVQLSLQAMQSNLAFHEPERYDLDGMVKQPQYNYSKQEMSPLKYIRL